MAAQFWWLGSYPLDGPVHRGSRDAEEFGELSLGVAPSVAELRQMLGLVRLLLPRNRTLVFATFIREAEIERCGGQELQITADGLLLTAWPVRCVGRRP
jgi:hypothetical protein